jgi:glycosyltransferase A (GT-A) superfamily protein (DUF2064 family)
MFQHMHVLVMAKEPIAGRVKTRLCPPCEPDEAAALAEAALADVLAAATSCGADRVILALDGQPGEWCPPRVEVVPQVDATFDLRLAAAWDWAAGRGVQVGMDTPQLTATDLNAAMATLDRPGVDATVGPAEDGGWWIIGLQNPDRRVFEGLPMSRPDTYVEQVRRLSLLELRWATEPQMRDVDDFDDAVAVAGLAPHTNFAGRLRDVTSSWASPVGSVR